MTEIHYPTDSGTLRLIHSHKLTEALPIVAIHGWLDNSASFTPIKDFFSEHPFYSLELPGHGHSCHILGRRPYHFLDYLPVLSNLVQNVLPPKFILMGHSMGAALSVYIAAHFPENVQKLILIDGLAPLLQSPEDSANQLQFAIQKLKSSRDRSRPLPNLSTAIKLRASVGSIGNESARLLVERQVKTATDGLLYWSYDNKLKLPSLYRQSIQQALPIYKSVQSKILLLDSESGYIEKSDPQGVLLAALPIEERIAIRGGHHSHMIFPQECASYIKAFL